MVSGNCIEVTTAWVLLDIGQFVLENLTQDAFNLYSCRWMPRSLQVAKVPHSLWEESLMIWGRATGSSSSVLENRTWWRLLKGRKSTVASALFMQISFTPFEHKCSAVYYWNLQPVYQSFHIMMHDLLAESPKVVMEYSASGYVYWYWSVNCTTGFEL